MAIAPLSFGDGTVSRIIKTVLYFFRLSDSRKLLFEKEIQAKTSISQKIKSIFRVRVLKKIGRFLWKVLKPLSSDDFDEKQLSSIILLPNQLSFLHSRKCVQMKLWPMFDHHPIIYWGNSSYCMLENKARTRVWPIKTSLLCILLLLQDKKLLCNSCWILITYFEK